MPRPAVRPSSDYTARILCERLGSPSIDRAWTAFAVLFSWTLYRAASPEPPRLQVVLALVLVCLSFALHMVYLPAGICCFFCLMLCKNELLLPAAARPKAE